MRPFHFARSFIIITGSQAIVMASLAFASLTIEPVRIGLESESAQVLIQSVLREAPVERELHGTRYHVLRSHFSDHPEPLIDLEVYDYDHDRLLTIHWNPSRGADSTQISNQRPSTLPALPPTDEEYADATQILMQDQTLGAPESRGQWRSYPAMPAILFDQIPKDLGLNYGRVIAVGILPVGDHSPVRHEIVGVSLSRKMIIHFPGGAPPRARATEQTCAPPNAGQGTTPYGTPGVATFHVKDGDSVIWEFTVTRPSSSSGNWGSGIDLRNVSYQGKKVISEIHVPILNVLYDENACGPFRDWQFAESPFQAQGSPVTSGILLANQPPTTLLESGIDRGNFSGVSIYPDGDEIVLQSEVQAAWYRYESQFRLHRDGTIQPRWGFAAVQDSCTCNAHTHHGYFRMDFDLGGQGQGNQLEVFDGQNWQKVETEARFARDPSHQRWRISNPASGQAYEIIPGDLDGQADNYGKGDVWALAYHSDESDDSKVYRGSFANLDAFLNREPLGSSDLVLWYGVHYRHVHQDKDERSKNELLGPTLKPILTPNP